MTVYKVEQNCGNLFYHSYTLSFMSGLLICCLGCRIIIQTSFLFRLVKNNL